MPIFILLKTDTLIICTPTPPTYEPACTKYYGKPMILCANTEQAGTHLLCVWSFGKQPCILLKKIFCWVLAPAMLKMLLKLSIKKKTQACIKSGNCART